MERTTGGGWKENSALMMIHTKTGLELEMVPALSSDLDRIVAIEQTSFRTPWTRLMFEAELIGNPFGHLLVARRPFSPDGTGEIWGYICYWVVFEELRFLNVAVIESGRRQGIGRQMVDYAIQDGIQNRTSRALLEVRTSNDLAINMYKGLGFQAYGRRKSYYTNPSEDAILMERMLLDPAPCNRP